MSHTILLLEDDIQLSETITQFLRLKGYEVVCAYDGFGAQEARYEHRIDLMLLDVKVPHIDGFEVLKEARKAGDDTPAIFITSLHSADDVEKAFAYGCDDYIRKPFALKELAVRIEALLKRRYGSSDGLVAIDEKLVYDTKAMRLLKEGEEIPLKTKERKLLDLFLRRRDTLLRYDEIFEALWDYDETPSGGSLRTYIKTLRAYLGKSRIETVKNIGYRFVTQ